MIKKIILLILFLLKSSSTFCMLEAIITRNNESLQFLAEEASEEELSQATIDAIHRGNYEATKLLLEKGATPPLLTAAKVGRADICNTVASYGRHYRLEQEQRQAILKRLILSGNKQNLETYFRYRIIKPKDISAEILEMAYQREWVHTPNEELRQIIEEKRLTYLHQKALQELALEFEDDPELGKKRKRQIEPPQKPDSKKLKYKEKKCAICHEKFKSGEITDEYLLPCQHVFHPECSQQWFKVRGIPQCPTCKEPKNPEQDGKTPAAWYAWIHANPDEIEQGRLIDGADDLEAQARELERLALNRHYEEAAAAAERAQREQERLEEEDDGAGPAQ